MSQRHSFDKSQFSILNFQFSILNFQFSFSKTFRIRERKVSKDIPLTNPSPQFSILYSQFSILNSQFSILKNLLRKWEECLKDIPLTNLDSQKTFEHVKREKTFLEDIPLSLRDISSTNLNSQFSIFNSHSQKPSEFVRGRSQKTFLWQISILKSLSCMSQECLKRHPFNIHPITDRLAQNLKSISKNFQFSTRHTWIPMGCTPTPMLLQGSNRKSHGQNAGTLAKSWKYSQDSVSPYLQLSVLEGLWRIENCRRNVLWKRIAGSMPHTWIPMGCTTTTMLLQGTNRKSHDFGESRIVGGMPCESESLGEME